MADKTVIVKVEYDTEAAVKSISNLTASIEGEKVAQAQLKSELEAGKIGQKEYVIEIENSKNTQSKANAERKNTIKLVTSEKGSINELKANITKLTQEKNKLNLTTTEGKKQSQVYTAQIKQMQTALKEAGEETEKTKGSFATFGDNLKAIPGPIGGIINGIFGMTKAALKFIATPLGAIIAVIGAALGALIKYFKGSEEGQNALTKVMAVFGVIAGNIGDIIQKVGELIWKAVTKPKEAWQGFKDFIKGVGDFFQNTFGNVIGGTIEILVSKFLKNFALIGLAWQKLKGVFTDNADGINEAQAKVSAYDEKIIEGQERVKEGVNNLKESAVNAYNNIKNAITGVIDETKKEIAIAQMLADKQARLDKFSRSSMVQDARDRLKLAELKNEIDSKDKNSAQERLKLIDEENALLSKIEERHLSILKAKYELKKINNSLSNSTKEDLDEEAQLLADVYNEEANIASQRKEAIAKRIEAINQIKTEEKAARDERLKQDQVLAQMEADMDAQFAEQAKELHKQVEETDTKITEDEIKKRSDAEIEAAKKIADAKSSLVNTAEKAATKIANDQLSARVNNQLNKVQVAAQAEMDILKNKLDKGEISEQEYNDKTKAIQLKTKQEEAKAEKKKNLFSIAIDTLSGVIKAIAASPVTFGLPFSAFVAAEGAASAIAVASEPIPQFGKGGIIGGKSHSQGGTRFVGSDGSRFVAEKGEAMFVLKKDATAEIAALSAINESYGGRSFSKQASHLAEGGKVDTTNVNQLVDEAMQRTPIKVYVSDIALGLTSLDNVKKVGVV